jgi:hypothetical protein
VQQYAAAQAAYADLEPVQPLPSLSNTGTRRSPAQEVIHSSGHSRILYAILGIGGTVAVLLLVMIAVLLRGGSPAEPPKARPAPAEVVDAAPAPAIVPAVEGLSRTGESLPAPSSSTSITSSGPTQISSSGGDYQDVVRRLRDATVYIKIKIKNRAIGSGTGFVIERRDDKVLIATNRHVAVPDLDDVPERIAPRGTKPVLEAVFRSGVRNEEQALPAQVIAADNSGDFATDLAFLLVAGVKRPPQPIDPQARLEPVAGMTYVCAGFPLGGLLNKIAETKGNPEVSITGGRIAAPRRDDTGQIAILQVDGSIVEGNSGGPIVDDKTGRLIGVAVAKIEGISTIGFIVPADEVRRCLAGRVGALDLTLHESQQGTADLQVRAQVVDPKRTVSGVVVHVAPASSVGTVSPNSDGTWSPLPNTTPVDLRHDPNTSTASGRVTVTLSGQGKDARKVLIQTAHRDSKGALVYSKPKEFELPEKPGRIRAPGALERIVKIARRKSASLLGPLIDPDKDCHLDKNDDNYKIKIEIPGKLHTLAPYVVTRLNKKKPLHNAPMTLAEVEGDFVALVEVTGEMSAGSTLPKDRQGNSIPFTFQGAGLLLYQNKDNFVRLERTAGVGVESLQTIHKVLIEIVKEGRQMDTTNVYWPVPEGDTQLIMIRRKGKVRFQFRSSGSRATFASPEYELDLPKKVKVGLSAANISAKPFTANFENFSIVNDTTMIDEEFSDPPTK